MENSPEQPPQRAPSPVEDRGGCSSDGDSDCSSVAETGVTQQRPIVLYDSSSSSSSCEALSAHARRKRAATRRAAAAPPTTEGELLPEQLPAIEALSLRVEREIELRRLGSVSAIVDCLVVIQSLAGSPGLDCDSVVFREDRTAIGKVFDLFGPVSAPYYSVRFNSRQHALDCGVAEGMPVFYAPGKLDLSKFVLLNQLRKEKGSDASWRHDNEPPAAMVEYSDDETERRERRKHRNRKSSSTATATAAAAAGDDSEPDDAPAASHPLPAARRRSAVAARRFPHPAARPPPRWPPSNRANWAPWARPPPPLTVGDWRHRPPPPVAAWSPPVGWSRCPPPAWRPPVATPPPPAAEESPEFRHLFNKYYDFYCNYFSRKPE